MSQGLTILAAVLVLADLAFCFGVGLKTRGRIQYSGGIFYRR